MPNAIDRTCQFFKSCGMSLNPRKCHSISAAVVSGKSVPRSRPSFYIQGRPVEALGGPNVFRYLGLSFGSTGSAKPTIYNLAQWLRNLERAPLKPDQKYIVLRSYLVPRLFYGLQSPAITGGILDECDRLVRRSVRKIFHLNVHTGSQFIHARIRDGGLGVTQLRHKIPSIFLSRMENLRSSGDACFSTILSEVGPALALYHRVRLLAKKGDPDPFWREEISNRPYSVGLQDVVDDASSRSWLQSAPRGWTGRDFVRAVQLRTGNLPTQGLPYKAPEQQRCRAGCPRVESISHVLQGCPVTHAERIRRHNEIVDKVAKHARGKGWLVEKEPYVRHQDGQLFKPDLAIHQPEDTLVICDVQVCWEGPRTLAESWNNKKLVYDNLRFRQAAAKHWGNNKHLLFVPLLLGARGVWPRCNAPTTSLLSITSGVRSSCVHSCLKWGSTLHQHFMTAVWRRRRPDGERALPNIGAHNVVPRERPTERPNPGADHRLPPPSGQG